MSIQRSKSLGHSISSMSILSPIGSVVFGAWIDLAPVAGPGIQGLPAVKYRLTNGRSAYRLGRSLRLSRESGSLGPGYDHRSTIPNPEIGRASCRERV